jgi:hypothetical protein
MTRVMLWEWDASCVQRWMKGAERVLSTWVVSRLVTHTWPCVMVGVGCTVCLEPG